jgi:transposase
MTPNPSSLRHHLELLKDSPEQLMTIILQQAERIAQLQAEVNDLQAQLAALSARPVGSVAPFRVAEKKRTQSPKQPGRGPGHPGSYRLAGPVTETQSVPLSGCPQCGGLVTGVQEVKQIIEELPAAPLRVVELTTFKGHCAHCGEVRSRHPLQRSDAVGAAGVHLGPRALSVAMQLQHQWHLSKRKTCQILQDLFGLSLTPGGLVSATHRLAEKLAPEDQALQQQVRQSSVLYTDETGWYVGRPGATLWVFTQPHFTLYRVVEHRTRATLQSFLGETFPGVLVSDCLSVYDDASPLQHKCYSHHLQALSRAIEHHPQGGQGFLQEARLLLHTAMGLQAAASTMPSQAWQHALLHLHAWADRLLALPRGQPQEESLRKRLFKQRDHLFTFLDYPQVDATNNLAERQLRPAVIARKLSCGNRTLKGARTWEVMASLAVTCHQTATSLADLVCHALVRSLATPKGR